MSHTRSVAMSLVLWCMLASGRAEAVQRAYVASFGLDSNTSFGCDTARPCRFFQAATTVVDPDGEVVVLDSGGYGAVTLNQSIALIAPTGVYAGISVFPGANGVMIATPGVNVVLRGLTINGQGGLDGISISAGAGLSIENCIIANLSGTGVQVTTGAKVKIIDTLLRNNTNGVFLRGGAKATISRTTILGGTVGAGITVYNHDANTTTTAAISDTTISNGGIGIYLVSDTANTAAFVSIVRSTIANTTFGIYWYGSTGTSLLTIGRSMVTGNIYGLYQDGAAATLESLGNNTVRQNTYNTLGTITTISPI